MLYSIAHSLSPEDVSRLQSLEQELGKHVLAFSPRPLKHSSLSESELQRLQQLEKELGVALVAVEKTDS